MKYIVANKYVTRHISTGIMGTPVDGSSVMSFLQDQGVDSAAYEIYELVPAKIIPASDARLVRA